MTGSSSYRERAIAQFRDMISHEEFSDDPEQLELRLRLIEQDLELEDLRYERSLYRQALDQLPTPAAIFDREMRYLYVTPNWTEGFAIPSHDLVGKNHYDIFPDIPEHWRTQHRRGMMGETLASDADFFVRPDGETEYIRWKLAPWQNASGNTGGIILYTDIVTPFVETERERVRVQQALRESESRYRQIFEGNRAVKLLIDAGTGRIVDANSAAEQFYGYSRERLRVMNIRDLQVALPEQPLEELDTLLRSGQGKFRLQQRLASGTICDVEVLVSVVDLNNKPVLYAIISDVTEQEQTRITLLDREERLRAIYEGAQDGIFLIDARGYYVDANPAGCLLTGYSLDELRSMHVDDLRFSGEITDEVREMRRKIWAEGGVIQEMQMRHKDGTPRWISMSISPLTISNQHYVLGIKRDIGTIRQVRNELLIKQRALDVAMNAIALADMNGIVTYVNPRFLSYWGYEDPSEVIGRSALDFWQKMDVAGTVLQGVLAEGLQEGELVAQRKDGSTFMVRLYASMIRDDRDQPLMLVGIFTDITEQRSAEQALIESEKRYRTVVSTMAESILVVDQRGKIISRNPSAERLFDLNDPGSNIFTPTVKTYYEDGSVVPLENFPVSVTLRTGQALRDIILGVKKADHAMMWLSINTEPIYEGDSTAPSAVIASIRDVTQRRAAEEAQNEARLLFHQLEQERETNHFRARMFSTIAHEFRTPLASISTTAEVLQRYVDRFSVPDRLQRLERIRTIVQHLNMLLDDMSYISKSQGGELHIQSEPIELDLFCNDVITDIHLAFQVDERISLTLGGTEKVVFFDPNILHKILNNLLSNAVKYTSPTGQVRLDVEAFPDQLKIVIADDGIGIPEEDQPRLFGLFQRGSNVGRIKGTGLGLAIVKDTIDLVGGQISYTSSRNAGTTFTISLPLRAG